VSRHQQSFRALQSFRARLDRATRRALFLGSAVLAVTLLVEFIRAA
jgi:hypothetical protein